MDIKRTGAAEYGQFVKVLICAPPGGGKTLISSTFPNPIYASAEGGLMSIADRDIPFVEVRHSDDLLKLKIGILDQPPDVRRELVGRPIDTVVVDTIDEVQKMLMRERVEETKKGSMELKDWGWLGEQMRTIVRGLRNLDMNVVLTAHLKRDKDEETGRVSFLPALAGAFAEELAGYVDLALLLKARNVVRNVDGEAVRVIERTIQTYHDVHYPWIKDRSGKLPQELVVNFTDDFARMHKAIYGDVEAQAQAMHDRLTDPGEELVPAQLEGDASTPVEADPAPPLEVAGTGRLLEEIAAPEPTEPILALFTCTDCGTGFDNKDQADLSEIRVRRVLCLPCYKTATKK